MEFYPIHFDKLSSTNDYCTELLSKSNPIEGTVISTYNQLDGKGQIGRKWFSDTEKNLAVSVILKPSFLEVHRMYYMNIMLSLAISTALEKMSAFEFKIKWPNDIYYKNKKLGGLLIKQSLQGNFISSSILGFGINVNQELFPDDLPNPISLFQITQKQYDLQIVLNAILKEIEQFYHKLRSNEFLKLKKQYLLKLYGRGEVHSFLANGHAFNAEIIGIDDQGRLSLHKEGKVRHFSMQEIKLLIS